MYNDDADGLDGDLLREVVFLYEDASNQRVLHVANFDSEQTHQELAWTLAVESDTFRIASGDRDGDGRASTLGRAKLRGSYAPGIGVSTALGFAIVVLFHLLVGARLYMPMVSPGRIIRYAVLLYPQDYLLVAGLLFALHTLAPRWTRLGGWLTVAALGLISVVRLVQYDALINSGEYLAVEGLQHADLTYLFVTPAVIGRYVLARRERLV
jgi:hypothetical protein